MLRILGQACRNDGSLKTHVTWAAIGLGLISAALWLIQPHPPVKWLPDALPRAVTRSPLAQHQIDSASANNPCANKSFRRRPIAKNEDA
jgi:hypothetical protein